MDLMSRWFGYIFYSIFKKFLLMIN